MTGWYLLAAIILLIANGFFVGAEFALTAARRTKIESLAEAGNARAKLALASIRDISFMLAGAQLGITMASLGLGYVAEPAVAALIEAGIERVAEVPQGLLHSISFVVALTIVVFFHMVIGEMAPKNIAIAEPERTALWLAVPFRIYVVAFGPIIRGLNACANAGLRLLGVEPRDEIERVLSAEELRWMVEEAAREGTLDRFEHRLLSGAISFTDLDAAAAMVPRTEITAAPLSSSPEDIERLVVESGHSRIPIFGTDLDNILGFFHAKDLLKIAPTERRGLLPRRFIRPMLVVPESRRLQPMLFDMRRLRMHFALVVDEHGGTAGIITLEDVIEELVGEIRDEHDDTELGIERLDSNRFIVPGTLRVHEAADRLGIEIPGGEYETVAGFVMSSLGRIPKRRDTVLCDGWRFRVLSMHRRRVVQVLVERVDEEQPSPARSDAR